MPDYTYHQIAKMLDHSLLQPALTEAELEAGCQLAVEHDVASVCILPYYLRRCAQLLDGSSVAPSTTVGFPHGGQVSAVKLVEAQQALADGARELDMVVNISQVLSGDWAYVQTELAAILHAVRSDGARLKVIFENCYLQDEHKVRLCEICGSIGVDWVKTSTGYGTGGATPEDVKLMRAHTPPHVQVKAAGGIRDLDAVLTMRNLGVTRIGASRTAEILAECRRRVGAA